MARQFIRADHVNTELGRVGSANLDAKYQGEYATIMANDSDGRNDRAKTGDENQEIKFSSRQAHGDHFRSADG